MRYNKKTPCAYNQTTEVKHYISHAPLVVQNITKSDKIKETYCDGLIAICIVVAKLAQISASSPENR